MSFFQRVQNVFGLGDPFDEADYAASDDASGPLQGYPGVPDNGERSPIPGDTQAAHFGGGANKVVGMPRLAGSQPEVVLMEPRSFEEIPQAVRALCDRKSVILNLGLMEPEQAQRAADYVAGGAYALDGHQERLGDHIFLFTPSFVQISNYSPDNYSPVEYAGQVPPHLTYTPTPTVAPSPSLSTPWSPNQAF